MGSARKGRLLCPLAAGLWLALHLLTLGRFPPMHADEAWLASETRAILTQRSPSATADFFHITPRSPHAIRLLFHGLQAPFVAVSWSLLSVRLLSLVCGIAVVAASGFLATQLFRSSGARLLFLFGLAVDPQLFVSAHLARPEIVLVLALVGALALRLRRPLPGLWTEAAVGSLLGLAVGVHANSLIPALAVGVLYAGDLLRASQRRAALLRMVVVVTTLALWALLWAGWSRLLSPDFPRAYVEFGRSYGVGDSLMVKLLRLPLFYRRLFDSITGTYYVPQMRGVLLMFAVAAAAAVAILVGRAGIRMLTPRSSMPGTAASLAEPLAVLVAVNAGLVAIGKFSQPSAVLLIPGGYWLASAVLDSLAWNQGRRKPAAGAESRAMDRGAMDRGAMDRGAMDQGAMDQGAMDRGADRGTMEQRAAVTRILEGRAGPLRARRSVALIVAAVLVAGLVAGTAGQAASRLKPGYSYSRYLDRIRVHVPPDARVLAGLNTAFAFEPGKLHAYNDLAVLDEAGLSFAEYVGRHGIEFILYSSELDRIYAARPVWNALYGNVVPYYKEMRRFLAARCELVARLEEPVFAMRIIAYQEEGTARLTVYRVLGSGP